MYIKHHREEQKGQVLLITIMLLAAAVTVVMTIAFNTTTETQVTKMEEDSQKALSAAETALESAIQQRKDKVLLSEIGSFNSEGITGGATVVEMGGTEFVTPLLQPDEQYTFYLAKYPQFPNPAAGDYWTGGSLEIFLNSEKAAGCNPTDNPVALELTFVDQNNLITRKLIDPCGLVIDNTVGLIPSLAGASLKDTNFAYKTSPASLPISAKKMVIVRVLNNPSRIGFRGAGMMTQGRVITSEAKTSTGVTKKIELFQSFPQIPSDFFVTSF